MCLAKPERCRHGFRWAAGLAAAAAALPPGPCARAAPPLEEIIVTARRQPEPLREVPLKIDVVTDSSGALRPDSLQDLIGRVPGLYFESAWGGLFSAPTLRGQQVSPAGDLNVGIFIDGVYQANPAAIDAGPVDIGRIEVVRGPQSALFGHSTFAGAIHYVSAAPTASPGSGFSFERGSAGYADARGYASGPMLGGALLGRIAVGAHTQEGTRANAAGGGALGGLRRGAVSLQLATPAGNALQANVSARLSESRYGQPAVASLAYADYNCGAIEPASGAWSYYCGKVPLATVFDSSTGIPDSDNDVSQLAVTLSWPLGAATLTSMTSYYRGKTDSYRDFDASSRGQLLGVCSLSSSCLLAVTPWPIERLAMVEEIRRSVVAVTEWNQELRLSGSAGRLQWSIGGAAWKTRDRDEELFGAERGSLADHERLTAVLPMTPGLVGPPSVVNLALVADPATQQVTQSLDFEQRRTVAVFGTLDFAFNARLRGRLEARATHERREIDNRLSNFETGFGTAIPAADFHDVTPRVGLQYALPPSWSLYASAAKGSQSGGINAIPGLLPTEQAYDPEFNWTYELAARYRPPSAAVGFDATAYLIDWSDAQVLGFGQTPNVANLITLNTAGIRTAGLELSGYARPTSALRAELDLSWANPEFRGGSDDPGSRRFCGLSSGNTTSTFCVIGPSRSGPAVLVPYIDGNVPARVPRRMWHAAVAVAPRAAAGHLLIRIDAMGQDDVFERAINGARFGRRRLIDARVAYTFGNWEVALWGRNLDDQNYVRALASRGQLYFPTSPRPLDALFADGRRIGLSLTYSRRPGAAD